MESKMQAIEVDLRPSQDMHHTFREWKVYEHCIDTDWKANALDVPSILAVSKCEYVAYGENLWKCDGICANSNDKDSFCSIWPFKFSDSHPVSFDYDAANDSRVDSHKVKEYGVYTWHLYFQFLYWCLNHSY